MSIKFSCVTLRHMSFEHALVALQRGTCLLYTSDKGRAADGTSFPAPPIQEGGGQFPVKGQDSHTEPPAHERKGNALDTHARLPVICLLYTSRCV